MNWPLLDGKRNTKTIFLVCKIGKKNCCKIGKNQEHIFKKNFYFVSHLGHNFFSKQINFSIICQLIFLKSLMKTDFKFLYGHFLPQLQLPSITKLSQLATQEVWDITLVSYRVPHFFEKQSVCIFENVSTSDLYFGANGSSHIFPLARLLLHTTHQGRLQTFHF